MMIRATDPRTISCTGYFRLNPERSYDLDKAKENERIKEILKEESQKIQPIYNAQGKVIGYDKYGRKLDILV